MKPIRARAWQARVRAEVETVLLFTKNLHIKSFTLISSCLFFVKVRIYTSSLLHCYQLPIFNLKYILIHQSERRYCNVSVANIFMPSSPSFINQEGLVSSFLQSYAGAHVLAGKLTGKQ